MSLTHSQTRQQVEAEHRQTPAHQRDLAAQAEGQALIAGYLAASDKVTVWLAQAHRTRAEAKGIPLGTDTATGIALHHHAQAETALAHWAARLETAPQHVRVAARDAELTALEQSTTDPHLAEARSYRYGKLIIPFADMEAERVRAPVPLQAAE